MQEVLRMKTYKLEIIMDAIDEDDFISVLFEMKHREFKPHITVVDL